MDSEDVKKEAMDLGAALCGIAPVERFREAPRGFHPVDIFSGTRSVVVIAKCIPEGAIRATSPVPYTAANDVVLSEVILMTCRLCERLERRGNIIAVPVPSEPYEYWDEENLEGKGILSLKHAGYLAGLGVQGRNSLLTNRIYGNRLTLGAALLDIELEGDPVADYHFCRDKCRICVEGCPVHAIDDGNVNQRLCRGHSGTSTKKGYFLYTCNLCRRACPNGARIIEDRESGEDLCS